jgi:hypothetical protein
MGSKARCQMEHGCIVRVRVVPRYIEIAFTGDDGALTTMTVWSINAVSPECMTRVLERSLTGAKQHR